MTKTKNQKIDWDNVQRIQFQHDRDYHPDIHGLDVVPRLKHMALHQTKYAAKLIDAEDNNDNARTKQAMVDGFIIGIATANILTDRLSEVELKTTSKTANSMSFAKRYLQNVGRIAKACESIDHLEDFPYRKELVATNRALVFDAVNEACRKNQDIVKLAWGRLKSVEEKSSFALFLDK